MPDPDSITTLDATRTRIRKLMAEVNNDPHFGDELAVELAEHADAMLEAITTEIKKRKEYQCQSTRTH